MEYNRILKDGIHLFAGKVGTVIISLVDIMLLARILTTEQMGKYSLFLMIVNLALVVGLNWSDSSIVRHGREEYTLNKKINQSFWARIYLFIPVMIIFTALFLIFNKKITAYIGIDQKLIYLVILMFILNGVLNFINFIYQSTDRMKKSAYVLLSQKVFYLICLAIVLLGAFEANLVLVLILINVSFLLSVLLNIITFDFDKIMPYTFNKEYFKKIWAYSWPQLIGFPGLYVINYIDIFVIKRYLTLQDVGIYNIAYAGFMNVTAFLMIIYTVSMPLIVEYKTQKKHHMIKDYVRRMPLFLMMWSVMVVAGLLLSRYIIPLLFSTKYAGSVPSFNILLISTIFYFASIYLLPLVNAFDLILYSQIFNLIKAGVNIAADFILVPKIGIIGAAYGTMISYAIGLVLTILLIMMKKKLIFGEKKYEK
ncbi:MAG: oligosaccharide flippase family protein [Candidatus Woesearchaeota archaeon]